MQFIIGAIIGLMALFSDFGYLNAYSKSAIPVFVRKEWVSEERSNKSEIGSKWAVYCTDTGLFIVNRFLRYEF